MPEIHPHPYVTPTMEKRQKENKENGNHLFSVGWNVETKTYDVVQTKENDLKVKLKL